MEWMTRRGIEWLSAAADDFETCRATWADNPRRLYLLPTGRLFDVVMISWRVGLETFDQLARREAPIGPVMMDHESQRVGFFLDTCGGEQFAAALSRETDTPPPYEYLSENSFVVAPGPVPMSGDRYQWLRAPMPPPEARPVCVAALAAVFVAAADLIARTDSYGEQYSAPAIVQSTL